MPGGVVSASSPVNPPPLGMERQCAAARVEFQQGMEERRLATLRA